MTSEEVADFLASERVLTCASGGPRGWPHLMPLWYVLREQPEGAPGPRVWAWTYAASQKVRNLERDPRATLLLEAGEAYAELRGVMLECEVRIHRELEEVAALGAEIMLRNALRRSSAPLPELPDEGRAMIDAQAPKRVGLEFLERRRASFDHRKLGGTY